MRTFLCMFSLFLLSGAAHAIEGGSSPADSVALVDPNTAASPFAGVGFVDGTRTDGSAGYGTATLLDPYHILTAAHVVNGVPVQNLTFYLNAGTQVRYHASAVSIDPLFDNFHTNDNNDFAVVTLSQPVLNAPYYSLYTGAFTVGTTLTLVGYGATGDGVNGYTLGSSNMTKRVGYNNADGFLQRDGTIPTSGLADPSGDGVYVFDFDGPNAPNYLGGTTLGNGIEANLGVGDSGGPAFVFVNGQYQIAGVNTFVTTFNNSSIRGVFGEAGGGVLVSPYTQAGGFLAPYAAPESGAWAVFLVGTAGILAVKRRRRPSDC